MKLFEAVVGEVEEQFKLPNQNGAANDPYGKLALRQSQTIIVHDEQDKFTKFDVSQRAANEMDRVALIATRGQGHGRVMKCPQVFESFDTPDWLGLVNQFGNT